MLAYWPDRTQFFTVHPPLGIPKTFHLALLLALPRQLRKDNSSTYENDPLSRKISYRSMY